MQTEIGMAGETQAGAPSSAAAWEPPFHVGQTFSTAVTFDADSIVTFASRIGDDNVLHHDAALAAQTRFGGLIASGGHTISMLLGTLAGNIAQRSHSLGLECSFTLRRAVKAGARMTAEWTIRSIEHRPSMRGHVMRMEGALRDEEGAVALGATLDVLVMPKEALFATPSARDKGDKA